MIIVYAVVYIWLTILFIWYGRHAKLSVVDRPLLLSSTVFNLLFELIALIWIGISIFLLFKNWGLVIFPFLGISLLKVFFGRTAELLENIALTPISYLYKILENWAKKRN